MKIYSCYASWSGAVINTHFLELPVSNIFSWFQRGSSPVSSTVLTLARGYKTFFMLNSIEPEKSLLINVKMPTIVGIFNIYEREK